VALSLNCDLTKCDVLFGESVDVLRYNGSSGQDCQSVSQISLLLGRYVTSRVEVD